MPSSPSSEAALRPPSTDLPTAVEGSTSVRDGTYELDPKPGIFNKYHLNAFKTALIAELFGSFIFILTIPLSSMNAPEMAPLAIGFMLMAMIFAFGYMSGGHFNPMVTISVYLCTSSFGKARLVLYIVAQMLGGFGAAFYCVLIHGTDFPVPSIPLDFWHMIRGFLAESVYTFTLCSVALHVACSKQKMNHFYGFAIGFALLSAALAISGISGAALNPAVATSLLVVRCFTTYCVPLASLWVFWASEVVGALMASIVYLAVLNIDDADF